MVQCLELYIHSICTLRVQLIDKIKIYFFLNFFVVMILKLLSFNTILIMPHLNMIYCFSAFLITYIVFITFSQVIL